MLKKIFKFFQKNYLFVLILILAAVLRFFWISSNPPALNWDEVSHGYNAYSILKTGKDEWGKTFPLIFRAYGDYKLPVYIYLTSLSESLFGLNAFAVRLPSVLAGIAVVLFTYLLVKKLINKEVAVLTSLLVAVEPWSFFLSRGAFEANLSLAFIVSGVFFFIEGLEKKKYLLISAILLGLSVWTYNSARIFVPLISIVLGLVYKKEIIQIWKKDRKSIVSCSLVFALFLLPMFWQLLNPAGQARYEWVAIIDEGAITRINEARGMSNLPPFLARAIHNKGTYFLGQFFINWFSHFSPDFLFFNGGSHYQFSIPNQGLLYVVNLAFFIIGLLVLVKSKKKSSYLILAWLVLGPVASSLTREAPHVLRAITVLPMPMVISAYGLISLIKRFEKYKVVILVLYIIVLIISAENYLLDYFDTYREKYSWAWQYGYEQAVSKAKENYGEFDKIIVTKKYGEPHEFFLFFWPWDPGEYRNDPNLNRFYQSNWYWVDGFDKFYFVNDWEIPSEGNTFILESGKEVDCSQESCLLITSPENYPDGWSKFDAIDFLDGQSAFELYENR
ncbi:MAG: glycosyltransferase family 39 protein [Patescibacteria group bacterium]